jgi:hypothetical protein
MDPSGTKQEIAIWFERNFALAFKKHPCYNWQGYQGQLSPRDGKE